MCDNYARIQTSMIGNYSSKMKQNLFDVDDGVANTNFQLTVVKLNF